MIHLFTPCLLYVTGYFIYVFLPKKIKTQIKSVQQTLQNALRRCLFTATVL